MKGTLIALVLLAVVMLTAGSVAASDLQWSGGVTLTETKESAFLGSRLDALHNDRLLGTWFSSSSQLPQVVQGVQLWAFGDFTGISKVEKVVLSPDHGKTQWPAELIEGKGYGVELPEMIAGGYALEWGVYSKDKHNKLMLIVIPVSWSSGRTSTVLNHLMVQAAPFGSEGWNEDMWFSCLRGFVSSVATPDMGYLAQQQAVAQMVPAPPKPDPIPIVQPKPVPAPKADMQSDNYAITDSQLSVAPRSKLDDSMDGRVVSVKYGATLALKYKNHLQEVPFNGTTTLVVNQRLIFSRGGKVVAEAKVVKVCSTRIEAVMNYGQVQANDSISLAPPAGGGK